MLILLVFAIDCVWCRTYNIYIYIEREREREREILYIYIFNSVLTWCRVSMSMCDSSRGDLAGVACCSMQSHKYTRGKRKTFQSFTGQPQRHSRRQNEGNQNTVS